MRKETGMGKSRNAKQASVREKNPIEEYEDRVVAGFLCLYPQEGYRETRLRMRMNDRVKPLLELNERYPADVLPPSLALAMIDDHGTSYMNTYPTKEDVTFVLELLPEACRDVSVRINSGIVISGTWGKHSSVYWKVEYADLGYPFRLEATRYADMDDLDNHSDECPMKLDEESEDYSDDCCCAAPVAEHGVLKLKKSDVRDEKEATRLVAEFLQKVVGW